MQKKTTSYFQTDYLLLDSKPQPRATTIQRILQFAATYQAYETESNNIIGVILN